VVLVSRTRGHADSQGEPSLTKKLRVEGRRFITAGLPPRGRWPKLRFKMAICVQRYEVVEGRCSCMLVHRRGEY
jgi:hypothetical protein